MKLFLDPDLSRYSDAAFEADLLLLPPQRREKARRFRFLSDRKRCVRAYMLLWEGLRREYGISEAPVFEYEAQGKPFLPAAPEIHFNLSHTKNAVLCALDSRPVGADVEMIPSPERLEHLFSVFSDREKQSLQQSDCPELQFARLWTRKESCLKLLGTGLTGTREMREVPTSDTDELAFETGVREADGFVWSVCQRKKPEDPIMKVGIELQIVLC